MSLKGKAEGCFEVKGRLTALDYLLMTAYGVALKNGFEGTEQEWLESLVGPAPSEEQILAALTEYFKDNPEGILYIPSVDANGNLSWTNNAGKANPATVNIKGPKGSDAAVTKTNIVKALGYTPANNADMGKKLDAYIFTGSYTTDDDGYYEVTLNDDYSWDDMVDAINANMHVGCVLWDDGGEYPVFLTLGTPFLSDGYVVFASYSEDGGVYQVYLQSNGYVDMSFRVFATEEHVDSAIAAVGGAKIQTGSYVGTGANATSSAPMELTFDFEPAMVLMLGYATTAGGSVISYRNSYGGYPCAVCPHLTTSFTARGFSFIYNNGDVSNFYAKKSNDGKTIYWYATDSGGNFSCYNHQDYEYHWLAIG